MARHSPRQMMSAALATAILAVALLGFALQGTATAQQGIAVPFETWADNPHLSSSGPPTMSAHGWWRRNFGAATFGLVTVRLQQRVSGGAYVTVAKDVKILRPGTSKRATARRRCHAYGDRLYTYRSTVDVDIIGFPDTPDRAIGGGEGGRKVKCSVLGRNV